MDDDAPQIDSHGAGKARHKPGSICGVWLVWFGSWSDHNDDLFCALIIQDGKVPVARIKGARVEQKKESTFISQEENERFVWSNIESRLKGQPASAMHRERESRRCVSVNGRRHTGVLA